MSALLAQAFSAIADAATGRPVHLRLPDAAIGIEDFAERVLARLAGAGLGRTSIAVEVPLGALQTEAGAASAKALRAAGVPLVLADWDMGLAAFQHIVEGGFSTVKVDARAVEMLVASRATAEVCRAAFRSLAALSVMVTAGNVGTDALARSLFQLGITAAEGPAFTAKTVDLRQPLSSAA